MTAMAHWLVRLADGDDPAGWGADWTARAEKLAELGWVDGWLNPPDWLDRSGTKRVDWGALLIPLSKEELLKLVQSVRAPATDRQQQTLEELDPTNDYAVIWIEESGQTLGPGQPAPSG